MVIGRFAASLDERYSSTTEFGRGVSGAFSVNITEIDSTTVDLITSRGEKLRYRDKNASNIYLAPSTGNALVKNGNGTWTETLPDGATWHYASTGKMDYTASPAGARWTLSYDGGGKLASIQNPAERRVTIGYDGSDKLQYVEDAGGRRTTFTVDGTSGSRHEPRPR